jgi:hypothetical protein
MKKIYLRLFTVLTVIALLTCAFPLTSLASDNELVLTKIGHSLGDTVSITNTSVRSVTLTVPFSYGGNTLDLSTGLIIEKASSIDSVITSFPAGAAAVIGDAGAAGPPVSMAVTYYKGGNMAAQHSTFYNISIMRAARKNPVFTGTITKTAAGVMPGTKIDDIKFSSADFTKLYTANDGGPLTNVSITGSSLSCGSLKLTSGPNYTEYISGRLISLNDIGTLVFDATGSGTVSYLVSAYAGADTTNPIGSVLLTITIGAITVPTIGGALSKSINEGASCSFALADFSSLYNLRGGTLDTIEITPAPTSLGVWYNGTSPFTGPVSFTSSTIGNLKFTGGGAGTAAFSWRVSNEAGFSDPAGGSVTVKSISAPVITSSIVKSVNLGATLGFSLNDFAQCCSLNNGTLKKIVITPSNTGYGTWYKGSSAFTGAKAFDSNDIGTLKFKGTVCGQAAFTWTVSNEKGTSGAGYGSITVNAVTATITYTTGANTVKAFSAADFDTACKDATGAALDYMYFSLPPASCGTLSFNYSSPSSPGTAVSSNTVFYRNKYPKISDVSFVPAVNYNGTFTITYTGVNTNGFAYSGDIKIIVGNGGDVAYFTPQNTVRTFAGADFNSACAFMTGNGLSYVYFSPPSSVYGTLYYGYSSPSSPGSAVGSNTPYTLQQLSYITFVPAANFTGALTIPYTGVASDNRSYTGYVKITVGGSAAVSYATNENTAARFSAADFNQACMNMTGSKLYYVYFSQLPAANGKLYHSYSSIKSFGSVVDTETAYFLEYSPSVGDVAFVPDAGFTGTVTIPYTGFSVNGTSFRSIVTIQVNGRTGSAYFADVGQSYEWAAGAIDYLYDAGIVNGTGGGKYSPGENMTRGDFLLMLHRAMGYTGSTKNNFSDVPKGSYYYDAIAIAKDLGIAIGSNNKIGPTSPLTRQDAMVYIYRALRVTGVTLTPGTNADLAGFADKDKISSYALEAVKALVRAGMIKGSGDRLMPMSVFSRAEMAVVFYRVRITY